MKYQRYEKYKDSGIEWLGEVPEEWGCFTIRRITKHHNQGFYTSDDYVDNGVDLLRITDIDDNSYIRKNDPPKVFVSKYDFERFKIEINDFLFARSGTIGRFGIVRIIDKDSVFASYLIRFKFDFTQVEIEYLRFWFQSNFFLEGLKSELHGGANQNIHAVNIKQRYVLIPPSQEQTTIANFLDRETTRIDTLISKKQKLIELLKEKRTALITRAVTKGLNPDARIKDSGIEWLGEVPEDWEVKEIKYNAKKVQTGITPPTSNEEYFDGNNDWFTPSDFSEMLKLKDSKRKVSNLAINKGFAKIFPKYSVLIVGIGATLGKVGYVTEDSSANQQINAIFFNNIIDAKFYSFFLHVNKNNIVASSNAATLAILNQSQTKKILVTTPSQIEKKLITNFLDRETDKIDTLISKIEQAITKHREYKTALISAAVTGKIKVTQS